MNGTNFAVSIMTLLVTNKEIESITYQKCPLCNFRYVDTEGIRFGHESYMKTNYTSVVSTQHWAYIQYKDYKANVLLEEEKMPPIVRIHGLTVTNKYIRNTNWSLTNPLPVVTMSTNKKYFKPQPYTIESITTILKNDN